MSSLVSYKVSRETLDGLVACGVLEERMVKNPMWSEAKRCWYHGFRVALEMQEGYVTVLHDRFTHAILSEIEKEGWSLATKWWEDPETGDDLEVPMPIVLWDDPDDGPVGWGDTLPEAFLAAKRAQNEEAD